MSIGCRACDRGTAKAEEPRNVTGTREKDSVNQQTNKQKKKTSYSSGITSQLTATFVLFRSEASPATGKHYESDNEAVIDPKLAMYRLHEGVSHASRASDVGELHRLQKSSTKPRHDGEFR